MKHILHLKHSFAFAALAIFMLMPGLGRGQTMQAAPSTNLTVVSTAGGLAAAIIAAGGSLTTVTDLTVTGTIDQRDFETMRSSMPALRNIDLSGASVAAYNAYPANTVPNLALKENIKITSVILPTSVTSIGDFAFQYCSELTSISIPTSVTSIGISAFESCSGLTSVTIPSSVTSIGDYAFVDCSGDITVDVGNTFYSSGDGVLFNKAKTTLITCPTSKIGSYAIPSTVTSIESWAFYNCIGLTSVTIPSSVTSIGSSAFYSCSGLTSVTIPSSVTSIGNGVFESCSGLTSVTIPSSVTSIGSYAFSGCSSLTSLYAWSATPVNLNASTDVFTGVPTSTCVLHVPVGAKSAYETANQWSAFTTIVADISPLTVVSTAGGLAAAIIAAGGSLTTVTDLTVTGTIDQRDFETMRSSMPALRNIDLSGASVAAYNAYPANTVPNLALKENIKITSVILPTSVTSIGDFAFQYCSELTSISIPTSVTSIGISAFESCSGLTSVTIPSSVTSIGDYAFVDCSGDITVDVGNTFYSSGDGVLFNKAKTTLITCPTSKIGSYAIPSTVTSIESWAFYNCIGLTSVTIPSSVTSIADYAFNSCSGLTSFTIPTSVTSIAKWTFNGCSGLTSITIPASVTSIGEGAFAYCSSLTSVTIPSSVTSIGIVVFANCSKLTSIYAWSATPVDLNASYSVFLNVPTGTCVLHVPVGATTAYRAANQWSAFINITDDLVIPTLTTQDVTSIGTTTATGNGNITGLGVPNPTQYGVVWSTLTNPTVALTTKTTQGAATAIGAFTSAITGLSSLTLYYLKAYATNGTGTYYGNEVSFTTLINTWTGTTNTDWNTATNWSLNVVPTILDDVLIPNVTNKPVVNQAPITPAVCNNLTIASGSVLTIAAGKALTVKGTLTNNATSTGLVIQSNASSTGSLIHNTIGVNATVERYVNAWSDAAHGWHLLSSPMTTQAISPFTVTPATDYDFYQWDEVTNLWMNQKDGTNNIVNFIPGTGYLVAYTTAATKVFTGTLNATDITRSGLTLSGGTNSGWNLLGNPFPSALTWGTGNWSLTNIAAIAKIWDEGDAAYNDINPGEFIPAMNGFMVQSAGAGSLTIPTAARVHNALAWYKSSAGMLKLNAHDLDNITAQESIIRVNDNATEGYDTQYDSHFLAGFAPKFYSTIGGEQLSTNTLPGIDTSRVIPMGFVKNAAGNFSIELMENSLMGVSTIYLTDNKTGSITNMGTSPVYSFTAVAGDDANRFMLSFQGTASIPNPDITKDFTVHAENGIITILQTGNLSGKVTVTDMAGRNVATANLMVGAPTRINLQGHPGVYVVSIVSAEGVSNTKVIIN